MFHRQSHRFFTKARLLVLERWARTGRGTDGFIAQRGLQRTRQRLIKITLSSGAAMMMMMMTTTTTLMYGERDRSTLL